MSQTYEVLQDVANERGRQNVLWGKQVHPYNVWLTILVEEVGEVAQAIQQGMASEKDSDADDLYEELIHVAAVATAAAEQVREERKRL
jgi:NTP pyrophosphatase (non-canonical NTP hydrolase)